jgi:RNA polymerase sigma factor (TIGR02999 family)
MVHTSTDCGTEGGARSSDNSPQQLDELFQSVYAELRRLAHRQLTSEPVGHTLSTTALVHEAYMKLAGQRSDRFQNRAQFLAIAATAMRRILVDYARRHRAMKRGLNVQRVSLSEVDALGDGRVEMAISDAADRADFLIALDDALKVLRTIDERLARVVEYRFFVGLTEIQTADILGVTPRTVTRDWVRARGWLHERLSERGSSLGRTEVL